MEFGLGHYNLYSSLVYTKLLTSASSRSRASFFSPKWPMNMVSSTTAGPWDRSSDTFSSTASLTLLGTSLTAFFLESPLFYYRCDLHSTAGSKIKIYQKQGALQTVSLPLYYSVTCSRLLADSVHAFRDHNPPHNSTNQQQNVPLNFTPRALQNGLCLVTPIFCSSSPTSHFPECIILQ